MIDQHRLHSQLFGFDTPDALINAFHKVQARPRAHVPESNESVARKISRSSPLNLSLIHI